MLENNMIRLFEDSIRMNWDKPAMSDFGSKEPVLTYGDVGTQIEKLHILLAQCGIEKNDKIALVGKNSTHWVITYVACMTYGAVLVPILQDFKADDMLHIINHSESKLVFADDRIWDHLEISAMHNVVAAFNLKDWQPMAVATRTLSEKELKAAEKEQEKADKQAYEKAKDEEKAARKEAKKAGEERADIDVQKVVTEVNPEQPLLDISTLTNEAVEEAFNKKFNGHFFRDLIRYDYKDNAEVGSINYTSGTTGFSKGVITPLNALAGQVVYALRTGLVGPNTRFVCFLPLAHAFGCAFDFLANFCAGGYTCYFGRPLAVKMLLMAFAQVKPTTILTVPLVIEKIYKKQIQPMLDDPRKSWIFSIPFLSDAVLAQVKNKLLTAFGGEVGEVILGGAPLNAEVEAFFRKIEFPFTVGYGMTECAPLISHTPHLEFKANSCGKVLQGLMEVRIDEPNAEGVGEIVVRGEHVMYGYYKNDEATRDTFTADGWLKTGDLGTIDDDGTIYIKGRNKTMLLGPSGQNIYPEEIEAVLNNMPFVSESIVLQKEASIVALVYPDYEQTDAAHLTTEQIREAMEENRKTANTQIAAYEQINELRIYAHEFEKTPKKSIKRFLYNAEMGESVTKNA